MKPLYLTNWHMNALIKELKVLYDNHYTIVPVLNYAGVKILTQWAHRTATFSFASDSHIVVSLSPAYPAVDQHILTTAILRVFKWEQIKYRSTCCGLLRRSYTNELHFAL